MFATFNSSNYKFQVYFQNMKIKTLGVSVRQPFTKKQAQQLKSPVQVRVIRKSVYDTPPPTQPEAYSGSGQKK